jgi:DNA-binding MarR family transcriptional regulator
VVSSGQSSGVGGNAECHPETCPCEDGACTLSRYVRTTQQAAGTGHHTLAETERAVADRLSGLPVDMTAMAAVQNVYRAANTVRNHLERTVLAPHDLTWTGWVVLWVVWIWGDIETRHVAAEAGISKGTLTGVIGTLEKRGLLTRRTHPDDARRVLVALTPRGRKLMAVLFPKFNAEEAHVVASLSESEAAGLARSLRKVVAQLETD